METLGAIELLAVMAGILGILAVFLLVWFSAPASIARAARLQDRSVRALTEGQTEKAAALLTKAVAVCERAGAENRNLAPILASLAGLHAAAGRSEQAEFLYRRALGICDKEPDHAQTREILPDILDNLTDLLRSAGREAESAEFEKRAKAVHDAKTASDSARTLDISAETARSKSDRKAQVEELLQRARDFRDGGQYFEADALVRQALRIQEAAPHPDDRRLAAILSELGKICTLSGKQEEAVAHYTHALHLWEGKTDAADPEIALVLSDLAALHIQLGRSPEAEPLLLRAIELLDESSGFDRPELAAPLNSLAKLHIDKRKFSEAQECLTRAEAILRRGDDPNSPELIANLELQASIYAELGREPDAARLKAQIEAISGQSGPS